MGEDRIETLAVLGSGAEAGTVHSAYHERRHSLATKHVAELGCLIEDLIETDAHEIHEHQFCYRPQAGRSGSSSRADEGAFADRRVEHPIPTEFWLQPLGNTEDAAPGIV